jgi:hypothetical protein
MGLVKLQPELSMLKMFCERRAWQTIAKNLLGSDFFSGKEFPDFNLGLGLAITALEC